MGILNLRDWEPWMVTLMQRIVPLEGGLFVDVGANIGQTLLKIKGVAPRMEYLGFEPNPSCNHYLGILIEKNNLKMARVIPIGIAQKEGIITLVRYNQRLSDSTASIVPGFRSESKICGEMNIPIYNLNTIKQSVNFSGLSVLKIDVEGAELEVLREFKEEIIEYQPLILLEILPVYSMKYKNRLERQQEIERMVAELNYLFYRIDLKNGKYDGVSVVMRIGIHSDLDKCDYILIPKNKKEWLELVTA